VRRAEDVRRRFCDWLEERESTSKWKRGPDENRRSAHRENFSVCVLSFTRPSTTEDRHHPRRPSKHHAACVLIVRFGMNTVSSPSIRRPACGDRCPECGCVGHV